MKRCCCVGYSDTEKLGIISRMGFECCEPSLSAMAGEEEKKVIEFRKFIDSLGISCASFNGLIPSEIALIGHDYDNNALRDYLSRAFYYARLCGTKVVTLGSGRSRSIPEGMEYDRAEDEFKKVLRTLFVPAARANGLTVGIEPLRREECNFLNTCASVINVAKDINEPEIGLTVDVFHAFLGGESFEEMAQYEGRTVHVHISSVRNLRQYPSFEDEEDIRRLYLSLKAAHYKGAVSIEGIVQGNFEATLEAAFRSISLSF